MYVSNVCLLCHYIYSYVMYIRYVKVHIDAAYVHLKQPPKRHFECFQLRINLDYVVNIKQ